MSNGQQYTGKVKWFNQYKGYGFVEIPEIREDVFLHFAVVNRANIKNLGKDDLILCEVEKTDTGYQVSKIDAVLTSAKFTVDSKVQHGYGCVKWFNPAKGFGFAKLQTGEDVFIHLSLLKKAGLEKLEPSTPVKLRMRRTNLGYEATDIEICEE